MKKWLTWKFWAAVGGVVVLVLMRLAHNWQRSREAEARAGSERAAMKRRTAEAGAKASELDEARRRALDEARVAGKNAAILKERADQAAAKAEATAAAAAARAKQIEETSDVDALNNLARRLGY